MDMIVDSIHFITHWADDALGKFHVYMALIALISGAWVLSRKKGTSLHRKLGLVYVIAMLSLNLSALMKYDLTGSVNIFHFFAVVSLATIVPAYGVIVINRKQLTTKHVIAHLQLMSWSYFGLVMALISETLTRQFPHILFGQGGWANFSLYLGVSMFFAGGATYLVIQNLTRKHFPASGMKQTLSH